MRCRQYDGQSVGDNENVSACHPTQPAPAGFLLSGGYLDTPGHAVTHDMWRFSVDIWGFFIDNHKNCWAFIVCLIDAGIFSGIFCSCFCSYRPSASLNVCPGHALISL